VAGGSPDDVAARPAALVVGAGFIGAHVAADLQRTHAVTVLTRRPLGLWATAMVGAANVVVGDAGDPAVVADAAGDAEAVVYCAGGLLPADSDEMPLADLEATLLPLLTVLDEVSRRPGTRIIFLSSGGTVYGEPVVLPVPESHALAPRGSYAVLKVASEHYLGLYRQRHGIDAIALRCGNVYGPGQPAFRSQGVVGTLLAAATDGRPFTVFGDGNTVRDYVHVSDVVTVIAGLVDRPAWPTEINVGTGVGTSVRDLIAVVEDVTGAAIALREAPARPSDLRRVVLDISRLRALMPYHPVGLRAGLAATLEVRTASVSAAG
jgi:UDP-glucose 4-epimerase